MKQSLIVALSLSVGLAYSKASKDDFPTISITQTWFQETNYTRVVPYKVYGNGGPMIIALHGNGGTGLDWYPLFDDTVLPNGGNFVLFMPTGYETWDDGLNSMLAGWNVHQEKSKAPDREFIEAIVSLAGATVSEVTLSYGVGLIGSSNGCGLVNRILIESKKTEFKNMVCISSELSTLQYKDGVFYAKNEYQTSDDDTTESLFSPAVPQPSLEGRSLFIIHGSADNNIPSAGGPPGEEGLLPDGQEYHGLNNTGLAWAKLIGCSSEESSIYLDTWSYPDLPGAYRTCDDQTLQWWEIDGAPHGMIYDFKGYWSGPDAYVSQIAATQLTKCAGCEDPAAVTLDLLQSVGRKYLRRGRSPTQAHLASDASN